MRSNAEAVKGYHCRIVVRNKLNRRVGVVVAVAGRNIIPGQKSWLKNNERMYTSSSPVPNTKTRAGGQGGSESTGSTSPNRENQLFDGGWLKKIGRNFRSAAIGPVAFISLFILGRNCASAI